MVRISILIGLIAGLLSLVLLVGGYWILQTPSGTRWLLTQLPEWTGTELQIGRIEGTLGGRLQLDDIELQQQGARLRIGHLSVQNRLLNLFPPALELDQLRCEQIHIQRSAQAEKKPLGKFRWPEPPWFLELLQLELNGFALRDFRWQEAEQAPLQLGLLRGSLVWQEGRLQGQQLQLENDQFQGQGSFFAGLIEPELKLVAEVQTTAPEASSRSLQITADLQPETAEQFLRGPVSLSVSEAEKGLLVASAELGLTTERLFFQPVQLSRPNRAGKITATGSLGFSGAAPELAMQLQLSKVDLETETGQPLQLSGVMQLLGVLASYRGQFELESQGAGPTTARLTGRFNGGRQHLGLTQLHGDWLSGTISGQAQVGWEQGWQLQAELSGRAIDPQLLQPQLAGQVNFDLQTDVGETAQGLHNGQFHIQLHDSILHKQPLNGEVSLQLRDKALLVEKLFLQGEGLQLQGRGNPAERLTVSWQIDRLQQLLKGASGRVAGKGWLRLRQQRLATEFSATAEQLAFQQWQLDQLTLQGKTDDAANGWQLRLAGEKLLGLAIKQQLENFNMALNGALADHQLTLDIAAPQGFVSAGLNGGWDGQQWRGELASFQTRKTPLGGWQLQKTTPLQLSANLIDIGPLLLRSRKGAELQLQGRYQPRSQHAEAELSWDRLELSLLQPWLADWQVAGQSSGSIKLRRGEHNSLHGRLSADGELQRQQFKLEFVKSSLALDWDEQGLLGELQVQLDDGGSLNGQLASEQAAGLTWPKAGKLQLDGSGFPLELFQPWLPTTLNLSGTIGLQAAGRWQAGRPMSINGAISSDDGSLHWQDEDDETFSADLSSAELDWQWHDRLQGTLDLQLRERGGIEAAFDLPLAASLPLAFAPMGGVATDLQASLHELGLLAVIFPERIQESHGQLKLDLKLDGVWQQPNLSGDFYLLDAGGYLPTVGVQLKKVELHGLLVKNRLQLKTLQLNSGEGLLTGRGELELENWQPLSYRLELKGEQFQLLNLPEFQARINPDLLIEGSKENIRIRGQVEFPDVLIRGKQKSVQATNSPDLIVIDREVPPARQLKLQHDIDLQLILGNKVLLNTAGIDARLEGRVRLQSDNRQNLVASGEIQIAKGKYSSYGVSLDINRGALYFTGGPLDQPALDILALRKSGEVQAGVKVSGTPKAPVVQLYSEPSMAETDVLSYIVLGRPIGADSSDSGLLLTAAGALLSQGESVVLQEKLKGRLGLDVLDISAGDGDVNSSIITTGKYLSPDLYISLGYSLFTNSNEMKVRYTLAPDWEVESSIGVESGIDMYYRIEID